MGESHSRRSVHRYRCEFTGAVPAEGLAELPRLESLTLRANRDGLPLGFLARAAGLTGLVLEQCTSLRDFETLTLESCGAGRLAFLRGAPRLRELTIVNTSDIPDLATLESLPELRRVRVDLRKHLGPDADSYIAALHRRGVEVTTDEEAESAVDPGDYDQWYQLDY